MLSSAIKRFSDNLTALREFVGITQPFLKSRKHDVLSARAKDLVPMILAIDAIPGSDFNLTEAQRESIKRQFDGDVDIEHKAGAENDGGVSLSVKGPGRKPFNDALKRLLITEQHSHLLHANSLIALVSAGEWFLSEILHSHFKAYPESAGVRDRSLTLRDLMAIGSVEEAQRYLIDAKVEEVLRGGFDDWIFFIKEKLHLSMSYADAYKDKMIEICQRRHLLVHNGGHINQIYLKKVNKELWCSNRLDDQVSIPKEFLDDAIDTFERVFTLIAFELWKKGLPEDHSRGSLLVEIAFERLGEENWSVAEGLSYFLMNDRALPERDRIIGQLNYWQAVKWQDRFEEIETDVRAADYSAKEEIYRLAQAALLDDEGLFFEMLPRVLKGDGFGLDELRTWPIFRKMRECAAYFENYEEMADGRMQEGGPQRDVPI